MLHDYGSKLPKNRSLFHTYRWWCPYSYSFSEVYVLLKLKNIALRKRYKKLSISYTHLKFQYLMAKSFQVFNVKVKFACKNVNGFIKVTRGII